MGKIVAGWIIVALTFAGGAAPGYAATTLGDLSRVTARSAMVLDASTNQVLFARNPNKRLPPASTTKLLTAILAMEHGRLDRRLAVSRYAASMPPTKVWLRPGWTPTTRDLMYSMLLRSANDASVAIAEGLGGSVPNFARMMNARAKALGATNSNFMNPNGLPNSRHYSSAADLAKIVKTAIGNPSIRTILSTPTRTVHLNTASRKAVVVRTTNRMISRTDFRVIGKTGYTRLAKRCFAGAASAGGREVIVVVLGSSNLWGDLELLIDFALHPTARAPQWEDETGWRQAARAPTPRPRKEPQIAQGDTTRDRPSMRFIYHVELASLKSRTLANDLLKRVSRLGYSAAVEPTAGKTAYRVVVRDLASRAIARRVARHLGQEFHLEPQIIAVRG